MIIMIVSLVKLMKRKKSCLSKGRDCNIFVEASGNDKIDGPFELLSFTQRYHLEDSAPNIVILLRIFLTRAISVASRERSFSKRKLIKNHLRSAMNQTRLTNLVVLSVERELADGLNFETVIKKTLPKEKAWKVCL